MTSPTRKAAKETEKYATSLIGCEYGSLHENDLALKPLRTTLAAFDFGDSGK